MDLEKIVNELNEPVLFTTWRKYYLIFVKNIMGKHSFDDNLVANALLTATVRCFDEKEEETYNNNLEHIREYCEIASSNRDNGIELTPQEILLWAVQSSINKRSLN